MKDINWLEKAGLIPALPEIALELIELFKNDEVDLELVVKKIEKDTAVSAKVLKLANSAAYNPHGGNVASIQFAAQKLGFSALRNIALAMAVSSVHKKVSGLDMDDFSLFSFLSACNEKEIIEDLKKNKPQEAMDLLTPEEGFTVGLLVSVGMLVMRMTRPDIIQHLDSSIGPFEAKRVSLERKVLGVSYEEVSLELAKKWGMPEKMIDAFTGVKKGGMITKLATLRALKTLDDSKPKSMLRERFNDFGLIEKYERIVGLSEQCKAVDIESAKKLYDATV